MCQRKLEPFYQVTPFIAEFWNTLSNAPFVIIGLWRLYELSEIDVWPIGLHHIDRLILLYWLYVFCGICSGIHHATSARWTIVIDWIPITLSIISNLYFGLWMHVGFVSAFQVLIALLVLGTDHVWTPINVPWGHCMWHILAAYAIDSCYQDVAHSLVL